MWLFKTIARAPKRTGLAIAVVSIGAFEGLQIKPYYDIGGVLTYCYGETQDADINAEYTPEQCKALLTERVAEFNDAVNSLVTVPMPPKREAAITSFTYNLGIGALKKSTLLRKLNAGDTRGACNELDRWVYVGRTFVRGLANRRKIEKAMCLEGLLEDV